MSDSQTTLAFPDPHFSATLDEAPQARSGPSASACRTCLACRRKKTRCDGQRPRCGSCVARRHECRYPQDGRRAIVKGRKSDVRRLQQEIEELRRQNRIQQEELANMSQQGQQRQSPADAAEQTLSPSRQTPSYSQLSEPVAPVLEFDSILPAVEGPPLLGASRTPRERPDDTASVRGSLPPISQEVLYEYQGERPALNDHDAIQAQQRGDDCQQLPSPETMNADDDKRVYGATSLLHGPTPATNSSPATTAAAEEQQAKASRHELVSSAAIGKQQENLLKSDPSLLQNVDFDGISVDLALYLLDLHWNRQHLSYLLTYRPAIMHSFMYGGPFMNKLLLNAIFFSTCLYDDRFSMQADTQDAPRTSPRGFFNRVKALLVEHITEPSLPTVVALLLCGCSLVPHGEQGTGWLFCGMAYRMIVDLGYHLTPNTISPSEELVKRVSATELEMRKRVYWGAYVCDTFQSLFLGRQPSLYRTHSTISSEFLDVYEEMEDWRPYENSQSRHHDVANFTYHGRPTYALSTFSILRQLCTIGNSIIEAYYSASCHDISEATALKLRDELRDRLKEWKQAVPSHLDFQPHVQKTPPPHQMTPLTTYWALVILTEQPFLKPDQFSFTPNPKCQEEARTRCIEAALKIWKILEAYQNTFTFRRAQYSISYAAYCAVLVMLQHATPNGEEYLECIQFFWRALLEHQRGCSQGLKRPLELLKSLMRRIDAVRHHIQEEGAHLQGASGTTNAFENEWDPTQGGELELLGEETMQWLASGADDLSFTDDTVFGMFM